MFQELGMGGALKVVTWTAQITTIVSEAYKSSYGVYPGSKAITDFTGYDATIWNKRKGAVVQTASGAYDESFAYPATVANGGTVVTVSSFTAPNDINVKLLVFYED